MKWTRILIALTALVLLAIFGALVIWYQIAGQEQARKLLTGKLRPYLGPSLEIGRLSLSAGNVILRNITLQPSSNLHLHIKEIQAAPNLWSFIIRGGRNAKMLRTVRIYEPRLWLRPSSDSAATNSDSLLRRLTYESHPLTRLKALNILDRVEIEAGSVVAGAPGVKWISELNARVEIDDKQEITTSVLAQLPQFKDAALRIEAQGSTAVGGFRAAVCLEAPDLTNIPEIFHIEGLEIKSGAVRLDLEAHGEAELRLSGVLQVDNGVADWTGKVNLSDLNLDGRLFGNNLALTGAARLNGVPVDLAASSDDILARRWQAKISSKDVDLAGLNFGRFALPKIAGQADFEAVASGTNDNIDIELNLNSAKLAIDTLDFSDVRLALRLNEDTLYCEKLFARIWGGELDLDGVIALAGGGVALSGEFIRSWTPEECPTWLKSKSPSLTAELVVQRVNKIWQGRGNAILVGAEGAPLITASLKTVGDSFILESHSPRLESGALNLKWTPEAVKPLILTVHNIRPLAQDIIDLDALLPPFFDDFDGELELRGDLQDVLWEAKIFSISDNRRLNASGEALRRNGKWLLNASLDVNEGENRLIRFDLNALLVKYKITLTSLTGYSKSGVRYLFGRGVYDLARRKVEQFDFNLRNLPLASLARYLELEIDTALDGRLDAEGYYRGDSLLWSVDLRLAFADDALFAASGRGAAGQGWYAIDTLMLTDSRSDQAILTARGRYCEQDKRLQNVIIRCEQFPLERAFKVGLPQLEARFGGSLNSLFEADGRLDSLRLTTDMHILNGTLFGRPGYWANLQIITGQDGYHYIQRGDLGKNLRPLLRIEGRRALNGERCQYRIDADDANLMDLIWALTGRDIPVKGLGRLQFTLDGKSTPERGRLVLSVASGAIADLTFDRLNLALDLQDLSGPDPRLFIDTALVHFCDAQATLQGCIPFLKSRPLEVAATLSGNLFSLLPRLDADFFSRPQGEGSLNLTLGGALERPRLTYGRFELHNSGIRMADVFRRVEGVRISIKLDDNGRVRIERLTGRIDDQPFFISNRTPRREDGEESIQIGDFDLGILQFATGSEGLWAVIPGLMDKGWGGYVRMRGLDGKGAFEFKGPAENPSGVGQVAFRNATFTYPFLVDEKALPSAFTLKLVGLLERMRWDAQIIPERGCHYMREVSGLSELPGLGSLKKRVGADYIDVDFKLHLDLQIDDNPVGLIFQGVVKDSLMLKGELTSTQGTIELLDLKFQVSQAGIQFSPPEIEPFIYGSAWTNVTDTLTGQPLEVRLKLQSTATGKPLRLTAEQGGRVLAPADAPGAVESERRRGSQFSDIIITFEDDRGHSQEQIIALLGYTPEQLPGKISANQLLRVAPITRWTRTLERQMEKWLGVDRVALETNVARNLLDRRLYTANIDSAQGGFNPYLSVLYGSRVTIGKYLSRNLYLSYTGALATEGEIYSSTRLGVLHYWDLLFRLARISNNASLNYRYEYDGLVDRRASSVYIRYNYYFDLLSMMEAALKAGRRW